MKILARKVGESLFWQHLKDLKYVLNSILYMSRNTYWINEKKFNSMNVLNLYLQASWSQSSGVYTSQDQPAEPGRHLLSVCIEVPYCLSSPLHMYCLWCTQVSRWRQRDLGRCAAPPECSAIPPAPHVSDGAVGRSFDLQKRRCTDLGRRAHGIRRMGLLHLLEFQDVDIFCVCTMSEFCRSVLPETSERPMLESNPCIISDRPFRLGQKVI